MQGRKRKGRKKYFEHADDYIPRELTSEEVKVEDRRARGRKYYAQYTQTPEDADNLKWDPPKVKESGYTNGADEGMDEGEKNSFEASITALTLLIGPSLTVRGQLPTLWQQKLNEIRGAESGEGAQLGEHTDSGDREVLVVESQLREKETIASQTSIIAQPPTPSFAALAATSPLPPSSPPPLSTRDLEPRLAAGRDRHPVPRSSPLRSPGRCTCSAGAASTLENP
ncbi:hypothetical protein R3P38DRAFT_3205084 [Favolaschia claudopus]|uniref:Uncharacterized protein n=1 Tax=Favolaschia claudopus TaxID=2862362 RepID=A0AAW0AP72_9AGAR